MIGSLGSMGEAMTRRRRWTRGDMLRAGMTIGELGEVTIQTGNGPMGQAQVCQLAAEARARGNPAFAGPSSMCNDARGQNIAAGDLILDAEPVDASMRVFLTDTGNRKIAGDPALAAAAAKVTDPDVRRGFAIGVQVARNSKPLQPAYASKVRATLSAKNAQGFDLGVAAAGGLGTVKAVLPGTSTDVPTPLLIGGGVVALAAIAAIAYKLSRKRR